MGNSASRWLRKNAPQRYRTWFGTQDEDDKHVDAAATTHKESLLLPRQHLAKWLMARTGHGPFRKYHETMRHKDAILTCSCGKDRTPDHITACPQMWGQKRLWKSRTLRSPDDWFSAMMHDPGLHAAIEEKGGFTRICPPSTMWRTSAQRLRPWTNARRRVKVAPPP